MCVFGVFDDFDVIVFQDSYVGVGGIQVDVNDFVYIYFLEILILCDLFVGFVFG